MSTALAKAQARDKAAGHGPAADLHQGAKVLTAAYTVPATENGFTYFLNAAGGFAVTLPNAALGLRYSFVVKTSPTGGNYTVNASTADQGKIFGMALSGEATPVGAPAASEDTIAFDANVAIVGDRVDLISDGTNWYVVGAMSDDSAIDFTT